MLPTGTRVLSDPATGRGTLITPGGQVWRLNPAAALATAALAAGGTAQDAEQALIRAWPAVPLESLQADLDALVGRLQDAGVMAR